MKYKKINNEDIIVASYPRSGNTWLRYAITSLMFPGEEISFDQVNRTVIDIHNNPEYLSEKKAGLRFVKTHHVYRPEFRKAIYIYRDIRDVAGSYYKFYKKHHNYKKEFSEFFYQMLEGDVAFGSWQGHIHSWFGDDLGQKKNILYLKYEDLLDDFTGNMRKVVNFLSIERSEEEILNSFKYSSILSQNKSYLLSQDPNYNVSKLQEIVNKKQKWNYLYSDEMSGYLNNKIGDLLEFLGYSQ